MWSLLMFAGSWQILQWLSIDQVTPRYRAIICNMNYDRFTVPIVNVISVSPPLSYKLLKNQIYIPWNPSLYTSTRPADCLQRNVAPGGYSKLLFHSVMTYKLGFCILSPAEVTGRKSRIGTYKIASYIRDLFGIFVKGFIQVMDWIWSVL